MFSELILSIILLLLFKKNTQKDTLILYELISKRINVIRTNSVKSKYKK